MQSIGWGTLFALLAIGSAQAGDNVWTRVGQPDAAVTALAVDPQNTGTVYAVTGVGLFKTVDDGSTWSALSTGTCCLVTLVIDPQSPSTLYAVTRAGAVLKSIDAGAGWTTLNSGLPLDNAGNAGVTSLVIDPRNPTTLYAGRGVSGGSVYKSTDGGASWAPVSLGIPDNGVMALTIDPQQPATVYASTPAKGVFQSTDGGATWTVTGSGLSYNVTHGYDYIGILAVDGQDSNTLYAAGHLSVDSEDDDSGLYRSTDQGASWTSLDFYATVTALAVDPRHAGTVYVGTYAGVSMSTDGGRSWRVVKPRASSDAYGSAVISALALDPHYPDSVYAAGTYAGLWKSTDAGSNWFTVNPEFKTTSPAGVVTLKTSPQNPGTIYAGTDTGFFKTADSGTNWVPANSGLPNGLYGHLRVSIVETDPQLPDTVYVQDPCCQEIYKSIDGGATWAGTLARQPDGLIVRGARLNTNALAVDPRNPRILYVAGSFGQSGQPAGGRGVIKSADGGASWTVMNAGLPDVATCCGFSASLAIDPENPTTVYVGTWNQGFGPAGDGVFKTTTGGLVWKGVGLAGHTRVDILGVDPRNSNTVYAKVSDFGPCCMSTRVFKSTNGGTSWSASDSGLPPFIYSFVLNPQNPAIAYAGTNSGVFRSIDGGASWSPANSGMMTLAVTALAIDARDSSTVYAGTVDGVFAMTFVP